MPEKNKETRKSMIGVGLIIVGLLLAFAQFSNFSLGGNLWPLFIIVPGIVMLISAPAGDAGKWVAAAGATVLTTGLILAYQNIFNHFESWAYAWTLLAPGASGAGWVIHGLRYGDTELVSAGRKQINVSAAMFLAGVIFFELILNISGRGIDGLLSGSYALPVIIVGLGVAMLAYQRFSNRDR